MPYKCVDTEILADNARCVKEELKHLVPGDKGFYFQAAVMQDMFDGLALPFEQKDLLWNEFDVLNREHTRIQKNNVAEIQSEIDELRRLFSLRKNPLKQMHLVQRSFDLKSLYTSDRAELWDEFQAMVTEGQPLLKEFHALQAKNALLIEDKISTILETKKPWEKVREIQKMFADLDFARDDLGRLHDLMNDTCIQLKGLTRRFLSEEAEELRVKREKAESNISKMERGAVKLGKEYARADSGKKRQKVIRRTNKLHAKLDDTRMWVRRLSEQIRLLEEKIH